MPVALLLFIVLITGVVNVKMWIDNKNGLPDRVGKKVLAIGIVTLVTWLFLAFDIPRTPISIKTYKVDNYQTCYPNRHYVVYANSEDRLEILDVDKKFPGITIADDASVIRTEWTRYRLCIDFSKCDSWELVEKD